MPHFINQEQKYYISTNYKVLYSLLYNQPSLQEINSNNSQIKMLLHNYLKKINHFQQMKYFLLVRNPYKRIESFYKDKFCQHPSTHLHTYEQLQLCQRLFCPYLSINQNQSPIEIRDKLLSVSFAQFINLLPNLYRLDEHLHPQIWIKNIYFSHWQVASIQFDQILKVELEENLHYLQEKLYLDLSKQYNNTEKVSCLNLWTPELRAIVNKLYQADFESFNYEMLIS